MRGWLGLPEAASTYAAAIDDIIVLVHWLMLVLMVGWTLFFLFVLVRFRKRANPSARYHGVRGAWSSWIEIGVLAAEVVLLVFFSIPVWNLRAQAFPPERGGVTVRVVAEQFAWNIHYPGADGKFGRTDLALVSPDNPLGLDRADAAARDDIAALNELHLPVGRPVIVLLSSKDVIHSFTLPEMRVKQDAVPGVVQRLWFTPTKTGEWNIVCSQLCGLAHYRMVGRYTIQSEQDYEAWLTEEAAALAAQ